ncbi:MAG: CDP-alcohol phosphatidyltransferase family protein [Pseudomonadota bacterium]
MIILVLAPRLSGSWGLALALGVFAAGAALAARAMHHSYPHTTLGLCNVITMSRLALTAIIASLLASQQAPSEGELWLAFGIAAVSLLLDGGDGLAARRSGLASRFGARFDMEVDALFALVLALLAFRTGQAGLWVVALGLPRYAFAAASGIWPQLAGDVPDNRSRKAVCVLQIGTLVAFLVPVLPATLLTTAAGVAALALLWSFQRDIHFLIARAE